MNKTKEQVKKNYSMPIVIVGVVLFSMVMFYSSLEAPLEKIMVLLVGFAILVPFIIGGLNIAVTGAVKQIKLNDEKNPYSRSVDANGRLILKSELKGTKEYARAREKKKIKYKNKVVETESYDEIRNMITACSKAKLLDRETILEFKVQLRNKLGTHYEVYKGMRFENDMHEIYVLIKSSKLTPEDYEHLTEWLGTHLNLPRSEEVAE